MTESPPACASCAFCKGAFEHVVVERDRLERVEIELLLRLDALEEVARDAIALVRRHGYPRDVADLLHRVKKVTKK